MTCDIDFLKVSAFARKNKCRVEITISGDDDAFEHSEEGIDVAVTDLLGFGFTSKLHIPFYNLENQQICPTVYLVKCLKNALNELETYR